MSLPQGPSGAEGALPGSAPSAAADPAGADAARPLGGGVPPRVRDVLSGRVAPVRPRDAATVMLVREGGGGLEVYLLRRVPSMRFAPGMYVFPGGSVDPRDADHRVRWAGPPPAEWARMLGEDEPLARSLVCAAVRETFEESGVLLAGASEHEVVADTRGDDWEADRRSLVDHTSSFAEFLDRRGLVLRSDLLRPWSRWITPVVEPRRFDTRFFAAVLPEEQQTRDVGGEADHVTWLRPAEALRRRSAGGLAMMAPTAANLGSLVDRASPEDVLAAEREVVPITPELREAAGKLTLVVPEGVDHPL